MFIQKDIIMNENYQSCHDKMTTKPVVAARIPREEPAGDVATLSTNLVIVIITSQPGCDVMLVLKTKGR